MTDAPSRKGDVTTSDHKGSNNEEIVRRELDKIRGKSDLTKSKLIDLLNKYPEEVVDEITKRHTKSIKRIKKKAEQVAAKVINKYHNENRPLHSILKKMVDYKIANKWTDLEYEFFRAEIERLLRGNRMYEVDYNQQNAEFRSRINRTLGYRTQTTPDEGLRIKDTEHGVLSEILSMYEKSLSLYRTNFIESLVYEDCALQATNGQFNKARHIAANHIHPLFACMFIPKIGLFEHQMLYSNIGHIIKSRYENRQIVTESDAMLFNDMITDPNDVVCEESSPIVDLKKRYQVQIDIWEIVQNLRNGKYYEGASNHRLLTDLNMCRNNLYDNADLVYSQDEGAMLRRLMSVFSLRPTLIGVKPIHQLEAFLGAPWASAMGNLQQQQQGLSFVNQPVVTVTKIPMLTVQLPLRPLYQGASLTDEAVDITSALNQIVWLNENKTLVPKQHTVIHSREVIIIYINRRVQRVNVKSYTNPISFAHLPISMSNFEQINKYPVDFPPQLVLSNQDSDAYSLRSVVAVTETSIKPCPKTISATSLITGCIGLIKVSQGDKYHSKNVLRYDPFGASIPQYIEDGGDAGYINLTPVTYLDDNYTCADDKDDTFNCVARTRGTIFIYAKSCEAGGTTLCDEFVRF